MVVAFDNVSAKSNLRARTGEPRAYRVVEHKSRRERERQKLCVAPGDARGDAGFEHEQPAFCEFAISLANLIKQLALKQKKEVIVVARLARPREVRRFAVVKRVLRAYENSVHVKL